MICSQLQIENSLLHPVIDWIDRELIDTYELRFEKKVSNNILLELRHHFITTQNQSLNVMIRGFYKYLPRLEKNFYLLGFRIRQWFSLNFNLKISDPLERVEPVCVALCQTLKNLDQEKKNFFEGSDYELPYHDIRISMEARLALSK